MPHIHTDNGQIDFTASAFIVCNGKVLLLKHKIFGKWLQPGGHVELTDSIEETLYKEIAEETGLDKSVLQLVQSYEPVNTMFSSSQPIPFDIDLHFVPNHEDHRHIDLTYLFTSSSNILNPGPDESQDLQWFGPEELQDKNYVMNDKTRYLADWAIQYIESRGSGERRR